MKKIQCRPNDLEIGIINDKDTFFKEYVNTEGAHNWCQSIYWTLCLMLTIKSGEDEIKHAFSWDALKLDIIEIKNWKNNKGQQKGYAHQISFLIKRNLIEIGLKFIKGLACESID